MELDTLVRRTLREWADEARVPAGLADAALRRRRRRVRWAWLSVELAAAVTGMALIAVNLLVPHEKDAQPGWWTPALAQPVVARNAAGNDLRADLRSPPRRLVTAGRAALSAYRVGPEWYMYDPPTGGYRLVPWAYVNVAKGLGRAAVLAGPLPTERIGIYDMTARRMLGWVPLSQPAATVAWSPDARRLLATHYRRVESQDGMGQGRIGFRGGFTVVDLVSGRTRFRNLPGPVASYPNALRWSMDGGLIWVPPTMADESKRFYTLDGSPAQAPEGEASLGEEAGLSPDRRLVATNHRGFDMNGKPAGQGPLTAVADVRTDQIIATQPVEQLIAWADPQNLVALNCAPYCDSPKGGEFHNRFVLVSLDGRSIRPLTGFRQNSQDPDAWQPYFTLR